MSSCCWVVVVAMMSFLDTKHHCCSRPHESILWGLPKGLNHTSTQFFKTTNFLKDWTTCVSGVWSPTKKGVSDYFAFDAAVTTTESSESAAIASAAAVVVVSLGCSKTREK